jgi:cytosine/adenosine deaminase-related metal-dependent hydrolase
VLLRGALLASLDPPALETSDLRIADGRIAERGRGLQPAAGEEVVDAAGALVLPGLVNAHTHLYSALARGMAAPALPPRNFVEVLERVWWRLDRALDEESVYLSALVGGVEAALSGTTLLVDHHPHPFIEGSLATIRRAGGGRAAPVLATRSPTATARRAGRSACARTARSPPNGRR